MAANDRWIDGAPLPDLHGLDGGAQNWWINGAPAQGIDGNAEIQAVFPTAEIAGGTWQNESAGAELVSHVNNEAAGDAIYIESAVNPDDDTCEFDIGPMAPPEDGPVRMYIRALVI